MNEPIASATEQAQAAARKGKYANDAKGRPWWYAQVLDFCRRSKRSA